MNQEKLSEIVARNVCRALEQNKNFVTSSIADGVNWDDGWEKAASQMVINSVNVSMRLSVQMVMTILYDTGVLKAPETPEEFPQLHIIRGGFGFGEDVQGPQK